jgi:hypothetical protein
MSANSDRFCICGCADFNHIIDEKESICVNSHCGCKKFILWEVVLFDPSGRMRKVTNIGHFIRDHPDEFDWQDTERRQCPSMRGTGRTYCRAEKALCELAEEQIFEWKGWTLCTKPASRITKL